MSNSIPNFPFVVGEKYRNEKGVYTVNRIDEPNLEMEISYENGETLVSSIRLQARIWERIQLEDEMAERRAAKRKSVRRRGGSRSRAGYGRDFDGLGVEDFGLDLTGTSWRRREELGGLLAERLSGISGETFESHAVPRRPQVHIVYPHHYQKKLRVAKLLFGLSSEAAYYGFYIEKSDEPMDETWDWPRFMEALAKDKNLLAQTLVAMQHCNLRWTINVESGENRHVGAEEEALYLQTEDGESSEGKRTAIDWDVLVEMLGAIPDSDWCNLYLTTDMEQARAVELGVSLANEVAGLFDAILPLYKASVGT